MSEKISAAEVARRLDVTRQAVSKAVRAGRLFSCGRGNNGRALYDWNEVQQTFFPEPAQVYRSPFCNRGGRPKQK
ncbi:MAG: helix-turn-helix domain-containing protein [Cystobacterineae bacterium]|nr:helix-turn-helix domain-containing protein [Cystobacterineae bacterium]